MLGGDYNDPVHPSRAVDRQVRGILQYCDARYVLELEPTDAAVWVYRHRLAINVAQIRTSIEWTRDPVFREIDIRPR